MTSICMMTSHIFKGSAQQSSSSLSVRLEAPAGPVTQDRREEGETRGICPSAWSWSRFAPALRAVFAADK